MRFQETEVVELKAMVQDDIKKEIIAFTNCNGGTVYIGVADNGDILGVENADECALQISNMVRDAIKPDVTMFIHYETLNCDGREVVAVNVQRGTNRPYYLAKKGLRPRASMCGRAILLSPATDTAIRQMIKETDGDSFENMRSIDQALTFEATKKEFEKRNVAFWSAANANPENRFRDGIYTNLGLLLSEQCPIPSRRLFLKGPIRMCLKTGGNFPVP